MGLCNRSFPSQFSSFDINLKKMVRRPILSNLDLIDTVSLVSGGALIDLFGRDQGELHAASGSAVLSDQSLQRALF